MVKIISMVGGSRDPQAPSLFKVVNLDNGEIKFIHVTEVKQILDL